MQYFISIHAPSRERRLSPAKVRRCAVFNPRSLTGATRGVIFASSNTALFQSTLPHGSDFLSINCYSVYSNFNPRSLAGATSSCRGSLPNSAHFNPRSLAGATLNVYKVFCRSRFQSTLPRGSDQARSSSAPAPKVFQSTLPRGSDILPMSWTDCKRYFNPRSLAGATLAHLERMV